MYICQNKETNTMKLREVSAIFYTLYLLVSITVESSTSQNYYGELAEVQMLNTTDPKTNEYILHINCKRFNTSLNFSDTIIESLGNDFITTPFITCLNFKGNKIKSIASGAFDSLPALEYLNLAGNDIQYLFSFNGHNNLKVLILSDNNYLNELHVFGEYPELRYLDLSDNKISVINLPSNYQNFFNPTSKKCIFPRLKYLDLSRNSLNSFGYPLLFNRNLTNLHLMNNNLYNVDLRNHTNLVELRVDNNYLEAIESNCLGQYVLCMDEMPKLKYFSISNNRLLKIDEDVFLKMPNLVTLDLSNNDLRGIFVVLNYELASLKNVSLDKNKISSILMLSHLPSLTILSAAHNELQEIISNFVNAPILKKLNLSNNEIKVIDENAFFNLKSLEELHLDNNNLDKLPIEWSKNLRNLRYLNLSNNNFKTLESLSLSQSLTKIKIDLININLSHMKAEVLWNLPENATIYLIPHSENNTLFKNNL